ncbi:MAG: C-terminal target protein, partial [Bacteroidota bacterium]|nr:C-terminal target protein [Bacteroidota bacterium]
WPGGYDSYHQPPAFSVIQGGNIHNGDTILISYFHTTTIYDGQVTASMSEPKVYDIIERELKILDSIVKPKTYFMNHDEIRMMNWDYGDDTRGMSPAEILADIVGKCMALIHKYNPNADIWTWSDMFDEYHNAVKSDYYLVNGDLTGSADIIPKSLGFANWNSNPIKVQNSLNFFESKGFRQISAPFYDTDQIHIRRWKEWMQNHGNIEGMIYTTWSKNYNYLEQFAEYSWNHAPYIYHYPLFGISPNIDLSIMVKITGDKWDAGWALKNAQLHYRTAQGIFNIIEFYPPLGFDTTITLSLSKDNKWLEYYITASDNRGWESRIPFGDSIYYQLGEVPVSVDDATATNMNIISVTPNPAVSGILNIKWTGFEGANSIEIIDILGRNLRSKNIYHKSAGILSETMDLNGLQAGLYFIIIKNGNDASAKQFVIDK